MCDFAELEKLDFEEHMHEFHLRNGRVNCTHCRRYFEEVTLFDGETFCESCWEEFEKENFQ